MAKNDKNSRSPKKRQIRWEVSDELYRKIGVYQKSHQLSSLEVAGNILLEKSTESVILAK